MDEVQLDAKLDPPQQPAPLKTAYAARPEQRTRIAADQKQQAIDIEMPAAKTV